MKRRIPTPQTRIAHAGIAALALCAVALPGAAFARAGGVETVGGPVTPPPVVTPCANVVANNSGAIMRGSGLVGMVFSVTNCSVNDETVYPSFADLGYVRGDATRTPCAGDAPWPFGDPAPITIKAGSSATIKGLAPYACAPAQEAGRVDLSILDAPLVDGGVRIGGSSLGAFFWTTPTKP